MGLGRRTSKSWISSNMINTICTINNFFLLKNINNYKNILILNTSQTIWLVCKPNHMFIYLGTNQNPFMNKFCVTYIFSTIDVLTLIMLHPFLHYTFALREGIVMKMRFQVAQIWFSRPLSHKFSIEDDIREWIESHPSQNYGHHLYLWRISCLAVTNLGYVIDDIPLLVMVLCSCRHQIYSCLAVLLTRPKKNLNENSFQKRFYRYNCYSRRKLVYIHESLWTLILNGGYTKIFVSFDGLYKKTRFIHSGCFFKLITKKIETLQVKGVLITLAFYHNIDHLLPNVF